MCGSYIDLFNLNAKKVPEISGYDIHIYFEDSHGQFKANGLAQALKDIVPQAEGPFQVKAGLGPHVLHNVEVAIPPESLSQALTFLQLNNKGLSILVHPHTGDEVKDHTTLANWVGKPVPLNLETLVPPAQRRKANGPHPRQ